ncbi:ubiquinol-cytochrome c reductase iron-sulfur subunit [Noviherbaspirillum sp. UKPF54]|uniref:ubiquinol-cytochrome c reductase iron-sulfur subunit n=1 Tax=Noviherbaspirillum sp. UKPF54 TaxID=2601898 RepID=UPI0011B1A3C2|nr:ubiquinol-cytochrome c reductase iron-sulfur subunit [Noviherbaspirillum sp. UKPF54]QDZ27920.1 ubiquinol-cytochrome c reductase iron-sulfur subunit [Noviherbaspirillum sp. UKPF54]
MDYADEKLNRRKFLLTTTTIVGGAGVVATAVPFLSSMAPSEAAKAAGAPVEVDLTGVEPGKISTVEWRGKPVWILHRTDAMLAALGKHDALLADPASKIQQQPPYATNPARAIRPPFFVAIGICTHLGCVPVFRPEPGAPDLGADWPGGFYCPCHGSKFDLAGRVFKNVPAPRNLEVPAYTYLSDNRLLIGADKKAG